MAKAFSPRSLVLLAATAAAASLLASPAGAQALPAPAGTPSWSKTDAILGGAPSALQAIVAQQRGIVVPAAAPVRPASYALPAPVPAIYRDRPAASPGVLSGRPDVFGSVALRVGATRLDARWHRVDRSPVGGSAARFAQGLRGKGSIDRLEAVNWYVNRRVRFVDDQRQYGRADVWASAADTLSRGRGDCEDFAIAKLQLLRRAGVADRDLYLVIVKDLVSRADHAVLVVRAAGRMLVLDNGTDQLLDSEAIRDYRPILTFAAGGTWTHGYRLRSAPMTIASADDPKAAAPLIPASENQRSWSASLLAFNTGFNK